MQTVKEKITLTLTGLVYALFHLGKMPDSGSIVMGTLTALSSTLPFEIAFTYLMVVFIRRTSGERPPWDRILRIFFTIGILFGLVYNLYVMGAIEQQRREKEQSTVSRFVEHDTLKAQPHSA